MKRGQTGEVDKHAIRRKIEEKQVMVREQRKVRERLSRECADTVFHIASTESTIKDITTKHKELLVSKAEDFKYATAANRREVHQLEEKCAELQRIIASSDVVEREQKVLMARLTALRVDDDKEEVANARELDGLKRKLFNTRNDLENVFRTTLHDLNEAYQDQAFDAMVGEATTAKEELPALRRDLRNMTFNVNRVMAKHSGSFAWVGNAKAERDLTDGFVKLQVQRGEKLRRSLRGQKGVIARQTDEMKDLGDHLETFQAKAVELRAAAAELEQVRAESARARKEYLQARAWAETLASKGPKVLKTELKRRRLASLTAAAVASFKSGRNEPGRGSADEGVDSTSCGMSGFEDGAVDGCSSSNRRRVCSHSARDKRREAEEEEEEEEEHGEDVGEEEEEGAEGSGIIFVAAGDDHLYLEGKENNGNKGYCYSQPLPAPYTAAARAEVRWPPERRDTLTLVTGREVGGTDVDVAVGMAGAIGTRNKGKYKGIERQDTVDQPAAAPRKNRGHGTSRQLKEENEASERIWRASLSGIYGNAHRAHTNNNSPSSYINNAACDAHADFMVRDSDMRGSSIVNGKAKLSAGHRQQQGQQQGGRSSPRSPSALAGVEDQTAIAVANDCRDRATNTGQEAVESSLPASAGAAAHTALPSSTRLDKLPTKTIANMLLSEHAFSGGDSKMSAVDVLERARQWEQQQQQKQQQQQQQQQTSKTPPSVPDLPYGFTDLGRRVNVRGVALVPNGGLVERDSDSVE